MISVDVRVDGYTDVTRHATEPEWDADDLQHTHTIEGWYRTKDGPYRINEEKALAYALYMTYSTGDSFHSETGLLEVMMLNQDEDIARKNLDILNRAGDAMHVVLYTDDGTEVQLSNPCFGYFEHLEHADMQLIGEIL